MNIPTLIVGAGPVGLTLACELTRYRVPVRIVDKAPQRTDKSKAIVLWSRTLELLDRGDQGSAPFVDAGFKVDGVNIVAPGGHVVGHVNMDSLQSPYRYALMLPQSDTERLLEERLQRLGVSVERSTEVTAVKIGADNVEATLRRADGAKRTSRRIGSLDATGRTASCVIRLQLRSPARRCTATGWRRRDCPGGLARRMRRRAQHRAPYACSSVHRRDDAQRLDSGRRPYERISVPRQ